MSKVVTTMDPMLNEESKGITEASKLSVEEIMQQLGPLAGETEEETKEKIAKYKAEKQQEVNEMDLFRSNEGKVSEATDKELLESLQKKVEKIREEKENSINMAHVDIWEASGYIEQYAETTILDCMVRKKMSFEDALELWKKQVDTYHNNQSDRATTESILAQSKVLYKDVPDELVILCDRKLPKVEPKKCKSAYPLSTQAILEDLKGLN